MNSKKDLVTRPIRGSCALQAPSQGDESAESRMRGRRAEDALLGDQVKLAALAQPGAPTVTSPDVGSYHVSKAKPIPSPSALKGAFIPIGASPAVSPSRLVGERGPWGSV
jgi:hypothetical protein